MELTHLCTPKRSMRRFCQIELAIRKVVPLQLVRSRTQAWLDQMKMLVNTSRFRYGRRCPQEEWQCQLKSQKCRIELKPTTISASAKARDDTDLASRPYSDDLPEPGVASTPPNPGGGQSNFQLVLVR